MVPSSETPLTVRVGDVLVLDGGVARVSDLRRTQSGRKVAVLADGLTLYPLPREFTVLRAAELRRTS